MTDEELKELVAANSRRVGDLQEGHLQLQEGHRQLREELREGHRQLHAAISRLEALQEEGQRQWQQRGRQLQEEVLASRAELDRVMTAVHRDLGRLGNRFGDYTEGLCFPALDRILREQFGMTQVGRQVRSDRNGDNLELDMFGHANDRINRAYIAEIKTTLRQDAIDQLLRHLRVFPEFFPHHRGKELYGILAAINAPVQAQQKVWKEGLYLVLVARCVSPPTPSPALDAAGCVAPPRISATSPSSSRLATDADCSPRVSADLRTEPLVSEENFQLHQPEGFRPRAFPNG